MLLISDLDFEQFPKEPHTIKFGSELIVDNEKHVKLKVWLESNQIMGMENWTSINLTSSLLPAIIKGNKIIDKNLEFLSRGKRKVITIKIDFTPDRVTPKDKPIESSYTYSHGTLFGNDIEPSPEGYLQGVKYEVIFPQSFTLPKNLEHIDKVVFPCSETARKVYFTSPRSIDVLLFGEDSLETATKKLRAFNKLKSEPNVLTLPMGFNFDEEDLRWLIWAISDDRSLQKAKMVRNRALREAINKKNGEFETETKNKIFINGQFPYTCPVEFDVVCKEVLDISGKKCLMVNEILAIRPEKMPFKKIKFLSPLFEKTGNPQNDGTGQGGGNGTKPKKRPGGKQRKSDPKNKDVGDGPNNNTTHTVSLPLDDQSTALDLTYLTDTESQAEIERMSLKVEGMTTSEKKSSDAESSLLEVKQNSKNNIEKIERDEALQKQNEKIRKELVEKLEAEFKSMISLLGTMEGVTFKRVDQNQPKIIPLGFSDVNDWTINAKAEKRMAWMIGVKYLEDFFLVFETQAFEHELFVSPTLIAGGKGQDFLNNEYTKILEAMALNKGSYKRLSVQQKKLVKAFKLTTMNHFYTGTRESEVEVDGKKETLIITESYIIPLKSRVENLIAAFKRIGGIKTDEAD